MQLVIISLFFIYSRIFSITDKQTGLTEMTFEWQRVFVLWRFADHLAPCRWYPSDDDRFVYFRLWLARLRRVQQANIRMVSGDTRRTTHRPGSLQVPGQRQGRPVQLLQHLTQSQKLVDKFNLSIDMNHQVMPFTGVTRICVKASAFT